MNPVPVVSMVRALSLTALLIAIAGFGLAAPATGQAASGNLGPAPSVVSPFLPPGSGGGGGGGGYTPPGDSGQGGGSVDPGGQAPDAGPTHTAGPRRTITPVPTNTPGRTLVAAPRRATQANAPLATPDHWRQWWEMNKFDFIQLRRIGDAPYTGQGITREDADERSRRLARVRSMVHDEVKPVLRELTEARDPAVRSSSIVALAKLLDEETPTLARQMLKDPSFQVRRSAMLALGLVDTGRAAHALVHIADDSQHGRQLLDTTRVSDADRTIALLSSAVRGDATAEALIEGMLDDRDDLSRDLLAGVCDAAGLMRSERAIQPLVEIARDDSVPEFVRSSATNALGRIGDPSVIPALMELLDDRLQPRRAAALALGLVAHPELTSVVERLDEVLEREHDASTKHFAAISLGRIGGPFARRSLQAAFEDASGDMKPWIALALGLCERQDPTGSVTRRFVAELEDESNRDVRGAFLIALGLCAGDGGLQTLAEELDGSQTDMAGQAALALGLTGHPDAQPTLRAALEIPSPDVQRHVALGLGILGDASTIPDLIELLKTTKNPYVASFAANGVAFMGDENAIGPLLRMIERNGDQGIATTYAVAAVGQLFDTDRRPALSRLAAGDNYLARTTAVNDLIALGF